MSITINRFKKKNNNSKKIFNKKNNEYQEGSGSSSNHEFFDCIMDNVSPLLFLCSIINRLCYQNPIIFQILILKIIDTLKKKKSNYLGDHTKANQKTFWELITSYINNLNYKPNSSAPDPPNPLEEENTRSKLVYPNPSAQEPSEPFAYPNDFVESYLGNLHRFDILKKPICDIKIIENNKDKFDRKIMEDKYNKIIKKKNYPQNESDVIEILKKNNYNTLDNFFYVREIAQTINKIIFKYFSKAIRTTDNETKINEECKKDNVTEYENITTRWINHKNSDLNCYLIYFKNINTVMISFRGTSSLANVFANLRNNFPIITDELPQEFEDIDSQSTCEEQKNNRKKQWQSKNDTVFVNHVRSVNRVFNTTIKYINEYFSSYKEGNFKKGKLICTGHSMGGGFATYFSYMYIKDNNNLIKKYPNIPPNITCIPLAPMKVFNEKARNTFENYVNEGKINYLMSFVDGDFALVMMPTSYCYYGYFHPFERKYNKQNINNVSRKPFFLRNVWPGYNSNKFYSISTFGTIYFDMDKYTSNELKNMIATTGRIVAHTTQDYIGYKSVLSTAMKVKSGGQGITIANRNISNKQRKRSAKVIKYLIPTENKQDNYLINPERKSLKKNRSFEPNSTGGGDCKKVINSDYIFINYNSDPSNNQFLDDYINNEKNFTKFQTIEMNVVNNQQIQLSRDSYKIPIKAYNSFAINIKNNPIGNYFNIIDDLEKEALTTNIDIIGAKNNIKTTLSTLNNVVEILKTNL